MKFFQNNPEEEIDEQTAKKMELAPLTNSGCESNFSQLDLECRRGSGQTTLQTMSNRHLVKTNQYFDSEEWKQLAPELKVKCWKEARSGEQAKIVKGMQEEFLKKVRAAESLARIHKIKQKIKKNEKCLLLLDQVKLHGGPVSANDVDKLDNLSEADVLAEVRYLRQTLAPNIREKRKVENKFRKFTKMELIQQIRSVLRPENEDFVDVNCLLLNSVRGPGGQREEDAVSYLRVPWVPDVLELFSAIQPCSSTNHQDMGLSLRIYPLVWMTGGFVPR